jgi:hypothetical protein
MGTFSEEVERLTPLMRVAEEAHRDHQESWKANKDREIFDRTLSAFWKAQRELEGVEGAVLESARAGHRQGVISALAYLSIRLFPFRSGYMSQKLARALKRAPLEETDRHILRRILLDRLTWPGSQPRDLWGLIPAVRTPELAAGIRSLTDDERRYVQKRAFDVISRYGLGSGKPGRLR